MSHEWLQRAVIYGIDPKSFLDSNGDGVGDLDGIRDRIDYLMDLGVDCVWLLPFYPSPLCDNGYDVTDHCAIDPRIGTLDQFERLVSQLHARGIRILVDLIANHTSDQHEWFQRARRDPNCAYRDYYIWSADKPEETQKTIFPTVEPDVWQWDDAAGAYYFHKFYHFEPGLNTANPAVRDEVSRIMDFWLQRGVDGFRVDAAPHLVEKRRGDKADRANYLDQLQAFVAHRNPQAVLLGETDVGPERLRFFFGEDGKRLNLLFNFLVNNCFFYALATRDTRRLADMLRRVPPSPGDSAYVQFLRNLDELDLEQLSDGERDAVWRAFAPRDDMRVYGRGIRRRLAPMLNGDLQRLRQCFSLLFSLGGIPCFVYGDEIGLGENLDLEQRESCRVPMQWSADPATHGGFSAARAEQLIRPSMPDGPFGFQRVNVAAQRAEEQSLWRFVQGLSRLRRDLPGLATAPTRVLDGDDGLLVLCSPYADGSRRLVTVHNFSAHTQSVELKRLHLGSHRRVLLDWRGTQQGPVEVPENIDVPPEGYYWISTDPASA